jgi:hypothetical protein
MKKIPIKGRVRKGEEVLVDDDIFPKLIGVELKYKDETARGRTSYVYFYAQRKYIRLHRFVLGNEKTHLLNVDHINNNTLDNRRSNLRVATRAQNNQNRRGFRGSVSKFKGVSKSGNRWRAQICKDGKNHLLGIFQTEEEAARNYDFYACRYHNEFAKLNFPEEEQSYYDGSFVPKKKPEGWVEPDETQSKD